MGKYTRKCVEKYNRRAVNQYDINGRFIRQWETVGEICRENGFDKSAILRCCKGIQKRSYWFVWKFSDEVNRTPNNDASDSHGSNGT